MLLEGEKPFFVANPRGIYTVLRFVLILQGAFYVTTGVWPLLHIDSFVAVTGPKEDTWLVHTVGTLIAVIGAAVLLAAVRANVTSEIVLLAIGCALGLAAIDVVYVLRDIIRPIYLVDAVVEGGIASLLIIGAARRKPAVAPRPVSKRVARAR